MVNAEADERKEEDSKKYGGLLAQGGDNNKNNTVPLLILGGVILGIAGNVMVAKRAGPTIASQTRRHTERLRKSEHLRRRRTMKSPELRAATRTARTTAQAAQSRIMALQYSSPQKLDKVQRRLTEEFQKSSRGGVAAESLPKHDIDSLVQALSTPTGDDLYEGDWEFVGNEDDSSSNRSSSSRGASSVSPGEAEAEGGAAPLPDGYIQDEDDDWSDGSPTPVPAKVIGGYKRRVLTSKVVESLGLLGFDVARNGLVSLADVELAYRAQKVGYEMGLSGREGGGGAARAAEDKANFEKVQLAYFFLKEDFY